MTEIIIRLTKGRRKRLIELAEVAGYNDDLIFLQDMINELTDSKELPVLLGDLMAKELNEK